MYFLVSPDPTEKHPLASPSFLSFLHMLASWIPGSSNCRLNAQEMELMITLHVYQLFRSWITRRLGCSWAVSVGQTWQHHKMIMGFGWFVGSSQLTRHYPWFSRFWWILGQTALTVGREIWALSASYARKTTFSPYIRIKISSFY